MVGFLNRKSVELKEQVSSLRIWEESPLNTESEGAELSHI